MRADALPVKLLFRPRSGRPSTAAYETDHRYLPFLAQNIGPLFLFGGRVFVAHMLRKRASSRKIEKIISRCVCVCVCYYTTTRVKVEISTKLKRFNICVNARKSNFCRFLENRDALLTRNYYSFSAAHTEVGSPQRNNRPPTACILEVNSVSIVSVITEKRVTNHQNARHS